MQTETRATKASALAQLREDKHHAKLALTNELVYTSISICMFKTNEQQSYAYSSHLSVLYTQSN